MATEAQTKRAASERSYRDRLAAGGGLATALYLPGPALGRLRALQNETGETMAGLLRRLVYEEAKRQHIVVPVPVVAE